MSNLNQINLVGRVGNTPDPEKDIKFFESGSLLVKMSLAVRRPDNTDTPDWFQLELWGKTAEIAVNHAPKGTLIGIYGELKLETWQDSSGNERVKPVVKVNRLSLLSSPRNQEPRNQEQELEKF